jgi:hypothetical protein
MSKPKPVRERLSLAGLAGVTALALPAPHVVAKDSEHVEARA